MNINHACECTASDTDWDAGRFRQLAEHLRDVVGNAPVSHPVGDQLFEVTETLPTSLQFGVG